MEECSFFPFEMCEIENTSKFFKPGNRSCWFTLEVGIIVDVRMDVPPDRLLRIIILDLKYLKSNTFR